MFDHLHLCGNASGCRHGQVLRSNSKGDLVSGFEWGAAEGRMDGRAVAEREYQARIAYALHRRKQKFMRASQ